MLTLWARGVFLSTQIPSLEPAAQRSISSVAALPLRWDLGLQPRLRYTGGTVFGEHQNRSLSLLVRVLTHKDFLVHPQTRPRHLPVLQRRVVGTSHLHHSTGRRGLRGHQGCPACAAARPGLRYSQRRRPVCVYGSCCPEVIHMGALGSYRL